MFLEKYVTSYFRKKVFLLCGYYFILAHLIVFFYGILLIFFRAF